MITLKKRMVKNSSGSNVVYVVPDTKQSTAAPVRKKRKPTVRMLFLIVFSLWAAYTFLFSMLPNKLRLDREHAELQQQLEQARQTEQKLTQDVNNLQSDFYIARLARKYYNMIKEGEVLYRPQQ
ncbi:FtsB family cell division protein [Effusibacillus dendaii]|uniref:Septum formation initiator family protein n=1 Tax=Effusibacillus dendaii TaxID=2743772 RepID=A0A7I8DEM0_9BACL|nr:septum formation initiator family protein [Effusibacillus dendaii]BCJ87399.1 hypothetical protein skT53_23840 [Effusibacillus dendaii]